METRNQKNWIMLSELLIVTETIALYKLEGVRHTLVDVTKYVLS